MKRILVAVDATDTSLRVASFVNDFFGELGVEVVALHVGALPAPWYPAGVDPGGVFPWPYPPVPRVHEAEPGVATEALREAERTVEDSGIERDETVVELGDPAAVIADAAREHGADLIVVGASHRGFVERLWSPSPTGELVKDAPVPVLVVH